jgi:hypothetical protein
MGEWGGQTAGEGRQAAHARKGVGLGIVRFEKKSRRITIECWHT